MSLVLAIGGHSVASNLNDLYTLLFRIVNNDPNAWRQVETFAPSGAALLHGSAKAAAYLSGRNGGEALPDLAPEAPDVLQRALAIGLLAARDGEAAGYWAEIVGRSYAAAFAAEVAIIDGDGITDREYTPGEMDTTPELAAAVFYRIQRLAAEHGLVIRGPDGPEICAEGLTLATTEAILSQAARYTETPAARQTSISFTRVDAAEVSGSGSTAAAIRASLKARSKDACTCPACAAKRRIEAATAGEEHASFCPCDECASARGAN